jgi:hypothetical protein
VKALPDKEVHRGEVRLPFAGGAGGASIRQSAEPDDGLARPLGQESEE